MTQTYGTRSWARNWQGGFLLKQSSPAKLEACVCVLSLVQRAECVLKDEPLRQL